MAAGEAAQTEAWGIFVRRTARIVRAAFSALLLRGQLRAVGLRVSAVALLFGAGIGVPSSLGAQQPNDTVTVVAGPQYEAGPLRRFLYGDNWRELWVAPVRAPVIDIRTFSGGLVPTHRGGGNQSITLHVEDAEGDRWIFRSIDKHPIANSMPWEVRGTPAAAMLRDHVSVLHPGGAFVMPPILEAVGILHTPPLLVVMPDDPALGEFRQDFAGMLMSVERRPNQRPGETPGFAGSRRVRSTDNFLDDIREARENRPDEHEFLRARLVDFLVGDPDRGTDQWRWARFGEEGDYTWRPIPADRDWVFADADGMIARVAKGVYTKLTRFEPEYPSIQTLTFSSHIVDRRMLTRLVRADFEAAAERVRQAVTDEVIEQAVAAIPPEWSRLSRDRLVESLRGRRDALPEIAMEFYDWLADAVDVHGTEQDELVEVVRNVDGTVLVTLSARPATADNGARAESAAGSIRPFYQRLFLPHETDEVRIYLTGGANHARITGTAAGGIVVRVIGGDGDDLMEDLAGGARFYSQEGELRAVRSQGTRVDTRPWTPPPPPEGLREGYAWAPDWGRDRDFAPTTDYDEISGVLIGAEFTATRQGFRRLPHHARSIVRGLYAPGTGALRGEIEVDYRVANSRRGLLLDARGIRMDEFPFHGFGDDDLDRRVVFDYDAFRLEPAFVWWLGPRPGIDPDANVRGGLDAEPDDEEEEAATDTAATVTTPRRQRLGRLDGWFRVGPSLAWTRMDAPGSQMAMDLATSRADVTQFGARAALRLKRTEDRPAPRRGFAVEAHSSVYPLVGGGGGGGAEAAQGALGAFGDVFVQARAYVPLLGDGPHLALRAGGERVYGEFPFFEAAFVGGRHSLRGSRTNELAGHGSLYGTVELRVPVDTVQIYIRAELGVFGFGDAARVWHATESSGWRPGWGGGAWLAAFGRAVSFAVARGEGVTRAHAWFGLPF
ncbi:hypothetical protein BH23GEM9_BH23GEM9_32170 [soil metagenome]